MNEFYLKVIKYKDAKFEKGRDEDAGYDLYSMVNYVLPCYKSYTFPVGIMTEFPPDWVGLVFDRSSTGGKGIMRQSGVIDSNYRGEWGVKLFNTGEPLVVESILSNPNAKAIAQVVFVLRGKAEPEVVQELASSSRGINWKGSTDK